jgi:hypothetical protein
MARGKKRSDDRREWQNTTNSYISVVNIQRGEPVGITVDPRATCWLTEEEEELTAKAPRDPAKNPFLDQPYELKDPTTGEVVESGERPMLILADEVRFVPPRGSAADDEETGTPGAQSPGAKAASSRRGGTRRAKAATA